MAYRTYGERHRSGVPATAAATRLLAVAGFARAAFADGKMGGGAA